MVSISSLKEVPTSPTTSAPILMWLRRVDPLQAQDIAGLNPKGSLLPGCADRSAAEVPPKFGTATLALREQAVPGAAVIRRITRCCRRCYPPAERFMTPATPAAKPPEAVWDRGLLPTVRSAGCLVSFTKDLFDRNGTNGQRNTSTAAATNTYP